MTDIERITVLFDELKGAYLSPCGTYRYVLWRDWDTNKPPLTFIMLNPSTADAMVDDPTIRRCIGFAERFGYGGITVVNLFAFRATNPVELRSTPDPVGPENDRWIRNAVFGAVEQKVPVVCAWGTQGGAQADAMKTKLIMAGANAVALGITKDGHPRHPLYLPNDSQMIKYV